MIDGRLEANQARLVSAVRRSGLGGLLAALLHGSGPLAFLSAQALYFAAPMMETFGVGDDAVAWAHLLEDPTATAALANRLGEVR